MEIIKKILADNLVVVLTGVVFITVGIIVPKFKMYWLIAGLNGLPKKEIQKYNLRYIEKYFGLFMMVLGVLIVINPILLTFFQEKENIGRFVVINIVSVIALMFLFGLINRKKIYNS